MKRNKYNKFMKMLSIIMTFLSVLTVNPSLTKAATIAQAEEVSYHGLKGDYYKCSSTTAADFASLVSTNIDENINFYSAFTDVLKARTGQTEGCAVRWTGKIQPKYSEDYTFYMIGDNGFRLWVNGNLIIDHWVNDWEVPQTSSKISLKAGVQYDFKLEYFQATGGADLKLQWSSTSQPKQVVPVECFYQPEGSQVPIVTASVEPVTGTCQQYAHPNLPSAVTVDYSDGTKRQLPVAWDFSDASLFSEVGNVVVTGTVSGTTAEAVANISVTPYVQWEKQQAPLMTKWSADVTADNALPDYPRMQMQRTEWQNLNGLWQFQEGTESDPVPTGRNLTRKILVPYPMESALSGIMTHYDYSWYRRVFTLPQNWNDKKIIINFGAVDWQSEVFVNGTSVGIHKGGYDPFSYDITQYLKATGEQELIVKVYDPTDAAGEPRGKQTLHQGGIMYTSTSGIWQTAWLEPVAASSSIDNLKIEPDVDGGRLKLTVSTTGVAEGTVVTATAYDGTTIAGKVDGSPNTALYIPITSAKLWSPDNPFLYDLQVDLKKDSTVIDTVKSYFGMRKISMNQVNGVNKIFLNNKETFMMGPLDQGFWPDGLYTAPTDAALKSDIEQEKALGFNMVRKHIKVEPARWYYWADKLGILVWQDMPSADSYMSNPPPVDKPQYELELQRMVQTHWNSPSIIMWCVFNEEQGQYEPARLVGLVAGLDSSRLINQGSGGPYANAGNIYDVHSYPPPACPNSSTQINVCGEYGGIGFKIPEHQWNEALSASYIMVNNADDLTNLYDTYANNILSYKTNNGLSAAVYTEITDVETEVNGLMTYDRQMKCDVNKIKASNEKVINKLSYYSEVLPTSKSQKQTWKYATTNTASDWYSSSFDDSQWTSAQGGFGTAITPGISVGTNWNTSDIWMRKSFNPGNLTTDEINNLCFNLFHDEATEIYINGVLAGTATGYSTDYVLLDMNDAAKRAIKINDSNVIAVHCHQTTGGQGIDVGIGKRVLTDKPITSTSFSDNFDSGNANQWSNFGGSWSVVDGKYGVLANSGGKSIAQNTNFSDFTYETDITLGNIQANNNAGVLFRLSSPGIGADNYKGYYAGLGKNGDVPGVVLGKSNGSWTFLDTKPMTIEAGKSYHMKISAIGSSIKVYVDNMDTPIIDKVDTSYISGAIGLRTWNVDARYDNISAAAYVPKHTEAALSDLKVGGATITGFDENTTTYNIELPAGTTAVPEINAVVKDSGKAVAVVTKPEALPGTAKIVVTAEDGVTIKTYTINFTVQIPKDTDATLKSISIDGKNLEGFDPSKKEYSITLPSGTTKIPVVSTEATKTVETVNITQADTVNGTATIKVTAEDGVTTNVYTVKFVVASKNDATLTNITVDGKAIPEFKGDLITTVTIPYTTKEPVITATATDANAKINIKQAGCLSSFAAIHVTSADGRNHRIYTLYFKMLPNTDASLSRICIGDNEIDNFNPEVLDYIYKLPSGTTKAPIVSAKVSDHRGINGAQLTIKQACKVDEKAVITVTAADGKTIRKYTVTFVVGQ
ncbi:PA14 domain-containing protein [Clostridium fungisolvens]|uniref:Beta-galactosidase n=1 Tax=Clostridium fungisolvens TaxID=1604897 RepID=A0A6V8SB49_9CLOT|nr:PA14 domain-containing protein [Clostridium fungisolvens]GFP74474.1 Beta-galactosidase [Clostridium fungisolvens]